MLPELQWYFPWSHIDLALKAQLVVWLTAVGFSWWIFWRSVVRKRPWLSRRDRE